MARRRNLVLLFYSSLIPSLLFLEKALACTGKDVEKMVGVLMEVSGWKGLAAELNIEIGVQNDIEFKCRDDAKCYRRSLVRKYCDSTGLPVELVAENISRALEPDNKRQANMIRNMFPSGDKSTGNEQPHSERAPPPPPHTRNTERRPGPSNGHETQSQPQATFLSLIDKWPWLMVVAGLAALVAVLYQCNRVKTTNAQVGIRDFDKVSPNKLPHTHFPEEEEVMSPPRAEQSCTTINSASNSSPSAHSQHSVRQRPVGKVDPLDDSVFDEQVTRVRLILIKYTDDNGVEAEFRVKKEIAPKWDDLASLLELQNAEITSIRQGNQHQDETCTDRMLMKWMEREENHSWRNLIQAMNGVQLAHAASVLAKALRNRI